MVHKIFRRFSHRSLRTLPVIWLLILIGCTPFSQPPTPTPMPTPTPTPMPTPTPRITGIEGRVYFSDNNEPIPDVLIRLNDPSSIGSKKSDFPASETKTNSEGYYSFTDINPGINNLTFSYVSDKSPKAVRAIPYGAYVAFGGEIKENNTFLVILETEIDVQLGDVVQENFEVDR